MKKLINLQRGFTLIEVMVVVVILGILAAIIVPRIIQRPEQAKIVKARQDVLAIDSALELYKLDNGFYPTTAQGLKALVTKPDTQPTPNSWQPGGYLKQLPVDPWGNAYQYANPGKHGEIDVWSTGPKQGEDIGNWK